eukprot:617661-Rhodomonas_salina.1
MPGGKLAGAMRCAAETLAELKGVPPFMLTLPPFMLTLPPFTAQLLPFLLKPANLCPETSAIYIETAFMSADTSAAGTVFICTETAQPANNGGAVHANNGGRTR